MSRDRALEERVQAEVTYRCGPNHALGGYRDDLRHLRGRIAKLKDDLERAYALEDAYVNIIADAAGERRMDYDEALHDAKAQHGA
jgi:hypothetical protein